MRTNRGKPDENQHETPKQDKNNNPNVEENIFTQETKHRENVLHTKDRNELLKFAIFLIHYQTRIWLVLYIKQRCEVEPRLK